MSINIAECKKYQSKEQIAAFLDQFSMKDLHSILAFVFWIRKTGSKNELVDRITNMIYAQSFPNESFKIGDRYFIPNNCKKYKVPELKSVLKDMNMAVSGTKDILCSYIESYFKPLPDEIQSINKNNDTPIEPINHLTQKCHVWGSCREEEPSKKKSCTISCRMW